MVKETQIQVRIMRAESLRAVNLFKNNSDPYAVVTIRRTGETHTTTVCLNTVNPCWYHNLIFTDVRDSDLISVHLYDKNTVTEDIDLGVAYIPVGEALAISTAILQDASYAPPPPPPTAAYIPRPPPYAPNSAPPHAPNAPPPYNPSASYYPSPSTPPPPPPDGPQATVHPTPHHAFHVPAGSWFQPRFPFQPKPSPGHDPYEPSAPPLTPPPSSRSSTSEQSYDGRSSHSSGRIPPPAESFASYAPQFESPPRHLPTAQQEHFRSSTSGLIAADASMQRTLTRRYSLSKQGSVDVIVAAGTVANLGQSAPRNHYKRFQTHKLGEQVGNIGKLPFQTKVGRTFGNALKSGVELAKPLHPAVDLFQPVGAVFQEHSTWKIGMRGVDEVFKKKRHGWNRNYPAAQKIFQGSGSVVARRLVQMQHAYLYGGASGIKPLVHARKDLMEITGNTIDAQDFLNLMEYGIRRGKPRLFTYVLMPDKLYMAETGAQFFRDMMSKHAMHSSASTEVVYAGELHFRMAPPGSNEPEIQLIIDNNSGTYAPGKEDLPLVEEVCRRNFPGLIVRGLDFQDPLLKTYTEDLTRSYSIDYPGAG